MRELDWRIHEYMGNDLTGWEWEDDNYAKFVIRNEDGTQINRVLHQRIPHYYRS